jgi:hypothetical protein
MSAISCTSRGPHEQTGGDGIRFGWITLRSVLASGTRSCNGSRHRP